MISTSFRKFISNHQAQAIMRYNKFSTKAKESKSGFSLGLKNKVTALVLVSFVVGVYYVSIRKMSEKDDLEDVIKTEVGKKSAVMTK